MFLLSCQRVGMEQGPQFCKINSSPQKRCIYAPDALLVSRYWFEADKSSYHHMKSNVSSNSTNLKRPVGLTTTIRSLMNLDISRAAVFRRVFSLEWVILPLTTSVRPWHERREIYIALHRTALGVKFRNCSHRKRSLVLDEHDRLKDCKLTARSQHGKQEVSCIRWRRQPWKRTTGFTLVTNNRRSTTGSQHGQHCMKRVKSFPRTGCHSRDYTQRTSLDEALQVAAVKDILFSFSFCRIASLPRVCLVSPCQRFCSR